MDCILYESAIRGVAGTLRCTADAEPWWRTTISVVTPLLVLASASIAWRSLGNSRAIARKKATLDLIEKVESTDHYRAAARAFDAVRRLGRFGVLHDPKTDEDKVYRRQVLGYIGHYELIAIGIQRDVLDETIYRSWMRSHVAMEWNAAADFIQNERWRLNAAGTDMEYRRQLFENFQWMACRWSPEARKLDRNSSPKPAVPTGMIAPGDVALPAIRDTNPDS
jgi:hypothetical protein